jgi:hypothetical protein
MPQRRYFLDSVVHQHASQFSVAEEASAMRPNMEPGKHCAYNQSRERFLGSDVDAADFSVASLDARLPALASETGAGLWLTPFRGISPTSVRVPLDLIYLDQDCKVIDTVESFPIFQVSSSSAPAASVLVLAADTIRSTETRPGDQLILCSPDEMKRRLRLLAESKVETKAEPTVAVVEEEPVRVFPGRLLMWEDRLKAKSSAVEVPTVEPSPVEVPKEEPRFLFPEMQGTAAVEAETTVKPERTTESETAKEAEKAVAPEKTVAPQKAVAPGRVAVPEEKSAKPKKGWLERWLKPDPEQPRKAAREALPGLTAYFFTGGAPMEHAVRDISLTGMYVYTKERWYPGTVVRMTLTDRLEQTAERSITLNMTVMRWGNDGVGLRFVLQNSKGKHQASTSDVSGAAEIAEVDKFIQRFKSTTG